MAVEEAASLNTTSNTTKNGNSKGKEHYEDELMALNEAPTEPYDPYAHRNIEHPTTNGETLVHILKGSIGTGILAMPDAFKNSGLIVGSIGTYLIAFLCTYCFLMLIRCQYEICKRVRKPIISYPDTMKYALRQGPPVVRFLIPLSTFLVDGFLIMYQLGICCVYTVFIAETLEQVLGQWGICLNKQIYMVFLLPFLIAITLIRNLKLLAPFSQIANVAMFAGIGIVLYFIFENYPGITSDKLIGPPIRYTFFIGTTLFALEAVGVFLALENNMKTPKDFRGVTGVFSRGMAFVSVLYMLMGFVGYVKYGSAIKGSVTLNIPQVGTVANAVKLIFAFAIYITYALQCYVPVDLIWTYYLKDHFSKWQNTLVIEYVLRIVCVIVCCLLAIAIPYLNLFISLIGALCLSMLGIAFPALIEICLRYPDKFGRMYYILVRDVILVIMGILAGGLGTVLAVNDIVGAINQPVQTVVNASKLDHYKSRQPHEGEMSSVGAGL